MKGYLFTALTILMFMSVFTVTYYFYVKSGALSRQDITAEKVHGAFDDVAGDLEAIIGASAAVENRNPRTVITFDDRIPGRENISDAVRDYSTYINGSYASDTNLGLSPDFSALSSSTAAVDLTIYPYGYAYGWSNLSKRAIWFRNKSAAYRPDGLNVTLDFREDNISDLIWLEAENFTADSGVVTDDMDASGGQYVESFALLNRTVNVPLSLNYTLWVRTVVDNTTKSFTVEVGGLNSTMFDIRNYDATEPAYGWFNDSAVTFSLQAGSREVKVIPAPSSGTDSVDVILLTTRDMDLPDSPPISRPHDPFEMSASEDGDMSLAFSILFANADYTYNTSTLSRTALSDWNITFDDNDAIRAGFGGVNAGGRRASSMLITIDNDANGSTGYAHTKATFEQASEDTYVDSGCSLNLSGPISRRDRLWLAKG